MYWKSAKVYRGSTTAVYTIPAIAGSNRIPGTKFCVLRTCIIRKLHLPVYTEWSGIPSPVHYNTYNDTVTDGTNKCGGNTFIITHMHAHLYTKMTTNQIQSPVMYNTDSNTPTNSKKIIT